MSTAMRWPTAVDYQSALQAPELCFSHPDLKRGVVTADALGLPLAATGNVVAVFRMNMGDHDTALRCFTRKSTFSALERRYSVLSGLIRRYHIPALVECTYLPDEVHVSEGRYAVVQMEWVAGLHLHRFITQHLHAGGVLHGLADQWRILMARLQTVRMAHGDLSDGNILVDPERGLRLVDYDAMFVPALKTDPPNELGKPNYQHPGRLNHDSPDYGYYAENTDAFASLVIYLTFRALAEDPSRWSRYHTGENLIFQHADYKQPGDTPIWEDLRGSTDAEVRKLTDLLAEYCRMSVAELPFLEEALPRTLVQISGDVVRGDGAVQDAEPALESLPEQTEAQDAPAEGVPVATGRAPDAEPIAPSQREARPWWRRLWMAGLGLGMVFVLAFGMISLSEGQVRNQQDPVATSPVVELPPDELAGFYTGYATTEDGAREPLALTIDAPFVEDSTGAVQFMYSINWKAFQSGGIGNYRQSVGHLDLQDHYELHVASASENELVLASREADGMEPAVKIKKKRRP